VPKAQVVGNISGITPLNLLFIKLIARSVLVIVIKDGGIVP
jgi:hypothetical protein